MSVLKEKGVVLAGGAVLALGVAWALSRESPPAAPVPDAAAPAPLAAHADTSARATDGAAEAREPDSDNEPIAHEAEVSIELAIIAPKATSKRLGELAAMPASAWPLTAADCGPDCAGVRKFLADSHPTLEVTLAADWILPPKDTLSTVARTVPEGERAALYDTKELLVVKVQGEDTADHLPLRGAFALTAAFARELRGYVHDEETHRIDTASAFAERVPRGPLGAPFFVPESLLVQLHPQDEDDVAGPYRLLTLGLSRYGCPDLEMHGFPETDGPRLASVLDAVAAKLAKGERGPAVTIALADVAQVMKKSPAELSRAPDKSRAVTVRLSPAGRRAGDPDNEVLTVRPPRPPADPEASAEASDEDAHGALLAQLFAEETRVSRRNTSAPDLLAAEARARKAAPEVAARWKKSGGGSLTLRVPFPLPGQPGKAEVMWMKATECSADGVCKGTLASRPELIKGLAAGADVTGKLSEVSDYLLVLPDGTKEGGETIPFLIGR
ncbi:MAG: DUF2314 domain-containing protein [Myxococcales bacterium]|nr:DUF2314 domain-containing protein [Myxococcales bacterium]MBL0194025.1 DUF2314 domain-containing protein [Myxococcales bacterium]HQY60459.1 DUF2314 domain-containing protein [Polyangiaceae bacterium]